MSAWIALAFIGLITAALTEVISNAAVIAVVLPIASTHRVASRIGSHTLGMVIPLAAGFAFVLPHPHQPWPWSLGPATSRPRTPGRYGRDPRLAYRTGTHGSLSVATVGT